MIKKLAAKDYYDAVYAKGLHVVTLYCEDHSGLSEQALRSLEPVDTRFSYINSVTLWSCKIETPEDAEAVQVVRMPQVRFFLNGSEKHSHVGIMEPEEILRKIFAIEEL